MSQNITLGMILTPTMAIDKGFTLIVSPELPMGTFTTFGLTAGNRINYYTTFRHRVVCITSLHKVAEYCHKLTPRQGTNNKEQG